MTSSDLSRSARTGESDDVADLDAGHGGGGFNGSSREHPLVRLIAS
jgi:hypothetical protein